MCGGTARRVGGPTHVVGARHASVGGQVARMGPWSLGQVVGRPHTSVWDVGVPWVGSERGDSGLVVGGRLSTGQQPKGTGVGRVAAKGEGGGTGAAVRREGGVSVGGPREGGTARTYRTVWVLGDGA